MSQLKTEVNLMGLFKSKHSVGKTIAKLRKENGWTQVEFAEKLNVSDKAVSKWESEAGLPEISQLPALAEIFNVSIDYIMTGKNTEEKIIAMSKIELCAKNDDISLLGDFCASTRDETGKSLMQYIQKYNSKKVLKALFNKCSDPTQYMNIFSTGDFSKNECGVVEQVKLLIPINCEIAFAKYGCRQELRDVNNFLPEIWRRAGHRATIEQIQEAYCTIFKELIVNYDKLTEEQKNYYFGNDSILKPHNAWISAYPYFLHYAYQEGKKELFEKLLNVVIKTNTAYLDGDKAVREEMRIRQGGFSQAYDNWLMMNIYIDVSRETVELAFARGDTAIAEKLNNYCKKALTPYDIKVIKVNNDKTLSKKDKTIELAIHDGILCISELLLLNDSKAIQKVLNDKPIHIIELIDKWLKDGRWREIYRYCIDNNLADIAQSVVSQDSDQVRLAVLEYCRNNAKSNINSTHLSLSSVLSRNYYINEETFSNCISKIIECKKKVIEDILKTDEKNRIINELTNDFFVKELEKGNLEIVIIKLCVRLECILRCDYHYEGDFSDMLHKYCSNNGIVDDGWGYDEEAEFVSYLHKLRKCRNSIVHPEKNGEKMTIDEIKYCIDYICKLG